MNIILDSRAVPARLLEIVNAQGRLVLQSTDFVLSGPQLLDATIVDFSKEGERNTLVNFTAEKTTQSVSVNVELRYNRLHLDHVTKVASGSITLDKDKVSLGDYLPQINSALGLIFQRSDLVDNPIDFTLVPPYQVQVEAASASYFVIGHTTLEVNDMDSVIELIDSQGNLLFSDEAKLVGSQSQW